MKNLFLDVYDEDRRHALTLFAVLRSTPRSKGDEAARGAECDRPMTRLTGHASCNICCHATPSTCYSQRSGRREPLVIALTGSTGTGKTETAWVLAEGLLTKRCRISGGTTDIPRGLLVFK